MPATTLANYMPIELLGAVLACILFSLFLLGAGDSGAGSSDGEGGDGGDGGGD
jgi:hypothetical protein